VRRGGSGALRRARPRSGPRGSFCLRQQQWHSPHCETHALGRADAPTTGRLERSGSRQARGGSYHSLGGKVRRRRGVLASRAADSVGVSARRFTSGAKKRRFSFFWSKSRNYRCMTLTQCRKDYMTSPVYLLEIEGLFTQGRRPGRTVGESVGGIFEMDSSDWSNGIRYHIFQTRPDTEFKLQPIFLLLLVIP